jgi:REP element-mobilizing transposase RayT
MADHVHMLVSIPPKYSVAEVIGFIKGKSSICIAQNVERKARNFTGHKFEHGDISFRRWGVTRRQSGPTSRTRSFRIARWINLR